MKYLVSIEVEAEKKEDAQKAISSLGFAIHSIEKVQDLRTLRQNNAMHLWFTQVAEALNDAGLTIQDIIKVERSWTMESFKELVYKHYLLKKYGKKSTTKMTKEEMDKIFDDINLWLGEKGVHVPFPSIENMIQNYD